MTEYHLYAEDGFEGSFRSLRNAEAAAKRGSKNRRMTYHVVESGPRGTGSGRGHEVSRFRNGKKQ